MTYYYSNNYHQYPYNYHQNQSYSYYPNYDYSTNYYEPNYIHNFNTEFYSNECQQAPSQSLVGYYYTSYDQHESEIPAPKVVNVEGVGSTGFAVSHTVNEEKDDDFDQDEKKKFHFHGGYDMSETYGKPLPPSDEICYPPTTSDPIPLKESQNHEKEEIPTNENAVSKVIEEEKGSEPEQEEYDQEEEEEEEEDDEEEEKEEVDDKSEEKQPIRRQIPPGYGIEALDLCEEVFGGYFPCFWKKRLQESYYDQRDHHHGNKVCDSDCDYWKGTADYLFGNPNPYGGSMPEKGSYGDPIYTYQRYYPQQALCEQVEYGDQNYSWMSNSSNY